MKTLTDVTTNARTVTVSLSTEELAMRLGYTGLNVKGIVLSPVEGMVMITMDNDTHAQKHAAPATMPLPFTAA